MGGGGDGEPFGFVEKVGAAAFVAVVDLGGERSGEGRLVGKSDGAAGADNGGFGEVVFGEPDLAVRVLEEELARAVAVEISLEQAAGRETVERGAFHAEPCARRASA